MPVCTYNSYHLGDNLIHLNWLRKVALIERDKAFRHYCPSEHLPQLFDVIEGVENLELAPLEQKPESAVDSWINADGAWDDATLRLNWVFFQLRHFRLLAQKLEVHNPAQSRTDLLFDFPELARDNILSRPFDVLVVNSRPNSGQFPLYSVENFHKLVALLNERHLQCVTTLPTGLCPATIDVGLRVGQIGALARHCKLVVGVDTGPMWPTFNVLSLGSVRLRMVFCHRHVFPLTDDCITLTSLDQVPGVLDFMRVDCIS